LAGRGRAAEGKLGLFNLTDTWSIIDESDMVMSSSRYTHSSRVEWVRLHADTPLTLTTEDLLRLQGLKERMAMEGVVEVYLPLSRLLNLTVSFKRAFTASM